MIPQHAISVGGHAPVAEAPNGSEVQQQQRQKESKIIRTLVPTDPLGFVHRATIVASECTDFAARHPSGLPSESLFSHTVSVLCLETEFATWQPALCAACTDFFIHSQCRMHDNCLVTHYLFLTLWHPQYFVGHLVFGASCTLS